MRQPCPWLRPLALSLVLVVAPAAQAAPALVPSPGFASVVPGPAAANPGAAPVPSAPPALTPPVPGPSSAIPAAGSAPLPAAAAAPPATPAAAPSLGLWLTTVDSAVLYAPVEAARAVAFLRHNGFRRVALPLYTAGIVTWTPASRHNRLAIPTDPRLPALPAPLSRSAAASPIPGPGSWSAPATGATASLLADLGQAGMERVGWFEFGLMAPADAPWLAGREDLLLRDAAGSTLWQESPGLNRVWLNPLLPEVQQTLEDLVVDACSRLPLELIQFDDHLGFPVRFGYDPATLAAWRATGAGRRDPSPAPAAPAWIAWRADQVTALLVRLRAAMATACPAVRVSVSPNPQEFSYTSYLADWSSWVRQGLVDEVVVQIYRDNLTALGRELAHPSLAAAAQRVPVRIGLLAGLKSQPKDPGLLQRERALVQQRGYGGIDLFFYESARRHFPEPPATDPAGGPPLAGS